MLGTLLGTALLLATAMTIIVLRKKGNLINSDAATHKFIDLPHAGESFYCAIPHKHTEF